MKRSSRLRANTYNTYHLIRSRKHRNISIEHNLDVPLADVPEAAAGVPPPPVAQCGRKEIFVETLNNVAHPYATAGVPT